MESIIRSAFRGGPLTIAIAILVIIAIAYTSILNMSPDAQEELLYFLQDFLPIIMFLSLAILLFSGFPAFLDFKGKNNANLRFKTIFNFFDFYVFKKKR